MSHDDTDNGAEAAAARRAERLEALAPRAEAADALAERHLRGERLREKAERALALQMAIDENGRPRGAG